METLHRRRNNDQILKEDYSGLDITYAMNLSFPTPTPVSTIDTADGPLS